MPHDDSYRGDSLVLVTSIKSGESQRIRGLNPHIGVRVAILFTYQHNLASTLDQSYVKLFKRLVSRGHLLRAIRPLWCWLRVLAPIEWGMAITQICFCGVTP